MLSAIVEADQLPAGSKLALDHVVRAAPRLERDDQAGARAEFAMHALTLSSRHEFDCSTMPVPRAAGCRRGKIREQAADGAP